MLDKHKIEYREETNVDIMLEKGFKTVPMLETDDKIMDYEEIIVWIKERN